MSSAPQHPAPYIPQIRLYQNWLHETRGLSFADYDSLWRWSTSDLDAFWQSIWDYFDLQSPTPHSAVLAGNTMPGAQWFPGAQVNYVQQVLRHVQPAHAAGMPAVISRNEQGLQRELSWPELQRQVAALALHLRAQGVAKGDRVAAYLPNIPEAIVAFLACASLGAIWSICAPDMGTHAVLDRFKQIAPKALIAVDGVHYAGKDIDRREVLQELRQGLPSVQHVVLVPNLDTSIKIADTADYTNVTARNDAETAAFTPEWLPFDHPLWIVYSSGTTGLPKPIVHGHGGMVLVALQLKALHNDIGCSYEPNSWGERYHWYSSTGWVMWNAQVSGLLGGTSCVIFDGSPGGSKDKPDWGTLWRFAAETGVTSFGSGAAFYANCMKAGLELSTCGDLSRIRGLGSTGSPLSAEVQQWGTDQFEKLGRANIWWNNLSGGTDFAGAFIGGNRDLPLVPGVMQCRQLGAAVEAWNEQGQPVMDEVGELVCTQPIPSMPLFLWGDADGKRYLSSYFDMYPAGHGRQPGGGDGDAEMGPVWRHGDWIKLLGEGGCIIYGRSDATINRHGLRMGTSEIYSAVEALPEVLDSMVVDLEYLGKDSYMPLFVALRPGVELDAALRERINKAIRSALSPRFVPDDIFAVAEIPRTLSGKKQELPIKKLLLGQPLAKVVNKDAMANPGCLDWYEGFAREYLARTEAGTVS
ncbi:acetoacetate--CoA ligase [Comamonas thiooxydans]|uniref:Acetoacetate--CoA ligase n=1 Tax=Comamonas thiooxydans TaxID=363952 RepID=A0AA42PXP8_9BURK|nr:MULTISPECIES: acetoacetate--CoA ligase [Comamonas]EFI59622.1 acetoacetyl-CoA synthetase [Comamonas thiooxydans]MDH1332681.1 acetoacetate--CoA ligase [Comamonas thiooxydans]MDH1739692.1 acetoacetate--CoA ligase [Comamonas thiooxydans]MDH1785108.1 acetoacetate--CoA ligase [Comamonas thiooxydans]TFF60984.1 acetoacetate--CoA ligase [Comamonas sp. A23]